MRDIKFRAFIKPDNKMVFVRNLAFFKHGYLNGKTFITVGNGKRLVEVDENCILMQYTGLKDKNGKEIYEGDIWTDGITKDIVKYEHSGFHLPNEEKIEVIGNIYKNPEFLKGDTK